MSCTIPTYPISLEVGYGFADGTASVLSELVSSVTVTRSDGLFQYLVSYF